MKLDSARIRRHALISRLTAFRCLSIVFVFGLLATSCSSEQSTGLEVTAESTASTNRGLLAGSDTAPKQAVSIAITDWTAAQANGAIAEKLIERRLGYPVELVDVTDIESLLGDLSTGEVDAILEVWTSTLEESEVALINSEKISQLGDLGVIAKVGWFVPLHVIEADPSLATWEGYVSDGAAEKFSTPATGSSGRFLGTNPDYVTYDEELIEALGLPFTVEYSGSDEATRAELQRMQVSQEAVLAYWWTPTAEITEFDLVNVTLPNRDADCVEAFSQGQPLRCDYPEENLVKLGWPGLADEAPDLDVFFRNFTLSTEDQLGITYAVETEGRSIDEVATEWIEANENRWDSWFSASDASD